MTHVDPLKLVRKETLRAYRQYQRAIRAAAQPWLTIALVAMGAEVCLFVSGLARSNFHVGLLSGFLMVLIGLSLSAAAVRAWLYQRSHPFTLPETPSLFPWRNSVR